MPKFSKKRTTRGKKYRGSKRMRKNMKGGFTWSDLNIFSGKKPDVTSTMPSASELVVGAKKYTNDALNQAKGLAQNASNKLVDASTPVTSAAGEATGILKSTLENGVSAVTNGNTQQQGINPFPVTGGRKSKKNKKAKRRTRRRK